MLSSSQMCVMRLWLCMCIQRSLETTTRVNKYMQSGAIWICCKLYILHCVTAATTTTTAAALQQCMCVCVYVSYNKIKTWRNNNGNWKYAMPPKNREKEWRNVKRANLQNDHNVWLNRNVAFISGRFGDDMLCYSTLHRSHRHSASESLVLFVWMDMETIALYLSFGIDLHTLSKLLASSDATEVISISLLFFLFLLLFTSLGILVSMMLLIERQNFIGFWLIWKMFDLRSTLYRVLLRFSKIASVGFCCVSKEEQIYDTDIFYDRINDEVRNG